MGEIQSKLSSLTSAQAFLAKLSSNLSVVVTSLLLFALIAWAYFQTKKIEAARISDVIIEKRDEISKSMSAEEKQQSLSNNAKIHEAVRERQDAAQTLRDLIVDIETGKQSLSDLPGDTTIADIQARISELEDDAEEIIAIATKIEATNQAYEAANTEIKSENTKEPQKGFLSRIGTFFISEGMFKTTSAGMKLLAVAVLLLSIPASLAITLPPVSDALETRQVELTETVREIEFDIEVASAEQNYEQALQTAETTFAELPEASEFTDDEVADGLARIFESRVIPQSFNTARSSARATVRGTTRHGIRNNILRNHATQSSGNLSAKLSRSASTPNAQADMASDFAKRSSSTRGPVTSLGKDAAAKNRAISKSNPSQWKAMKGQYTNYMKSFGRVAPPQQIRSLAVSQILGDVIPSGTTAPSALGRSFQQAASNLSADTIEAYSNAAYKNFTADIAKGVPIEDALDNNKKLSSLSLSNQNTARLRSITQDVPDRAKLGEISAKNRVHLYSRAGTGVSDEVQRSIARLSKIQGFRTAQSAEALASFADYFPSQAGDQQRTTWAKAAQSNGLDGAPPRPGAESSKYRQTARNNLGRSRSFGRLRGFSRVGGVLIGREPDRVDINDLSNSDILELSSMKWEMKGRSVYFNLQVKDQATRRIGPFDPAIVNLALAYAADGRPTTVTMVKAEPLTDLKILNHVTLADTGLGCRARRLDQFVDEVTSEDSFLENARTQATQNALNEILFYEYARALRLDNYLQRSAVTSELPGEQVQNWRLEARDTMAQPSIVESVQSMLGQGNALYIASKPVYFDAKLVNAMQSCKVKEDISSLNACLNSEFEPPYDSALINGNLNWLAPAPDYDVWSGVREDEFSLDQDLSFLTLKQNQTTWPFNFIVQIAVKSPAYFADKNTSWLEDDNDKRDDYVDLSPWEFTSLEQTLNSSIAKAVVSNRERKSVMKDMQQFAILQRFFRGLLDGYIVADDVDMEMLESLQTETQPFINSSSPTLRWNPSPGGIESNLYNYLSGQLEEPENQSDIEAILSCATLIGDTSEYGNLALAKISNEKWTNSCDPSNFQNETLRSIVDYFGAARQLRASLKVDDNLSLSQKYAEEGCPRP